MEVREYLLSQYGLEAIGSGISAAPSIHVGMAMMIFMMVRERSSRLWPTILAGAYVALIFVGSIHLAWHYAMDGLLSILLVPLMWYGLGRFLDRLEQKRPTVEQIRPVIKPVPGF